MGKILIRDAAVLAEEGWVHPGYVLIDGDKVLSVKAGDPPESVQADEVLSFPHGAVMPGMINGHTHFSQTFMRGLAGGRELLSWLKNLIWPLQGAMTPEELRLAAYLGLLENLRSGVTHVVDHHKVAGTHAHTDAVCAAAEEVGLRFTLARSWSDKGKNAETHESIYADLERLFERWKGHSRVQVANGPLALWRCSEDMLHRTHELARNYDSFTHFHVAETQSEVQMSVEEYGLRPIEWLNSIGMLNEYTQVVHAVWATGAEIQALAESGSLVVHCPVSNAVLGSGVAPVAKMLPVGVSLRLGTDGPASNDTQDIWETLKAALNFARATAMDPTVLPPSQALRIANGNRILSPGVPADLIVVDLNHTRAVPVQDVDSALVMCSHGSDVDTVIVEGKILMKNKKVLVLDEELLLDQCRKAIVGLRKRAGLV